MGPFYCPVDQRVYIDLGFYDELTNRFGAPGDFAQAYVLAHELGHHVQHLLGTDARMRQLQESRPDRANNLSVRLELQADCYAGVWANSTDQRKLLNESDITEALTAASAVGDDRIQQEETGSIHPESFTHGTAAQRASWFKRGYTSGRPDACDTFAGAI
jgi:predicted metalloprotease